MYTRKCFTSRFEDGVLLELDYKQIEIFVLAFLSQDKQLIDDLLSGADLHAISAENLFGSRFTKEQRRIAKQLSFQLQYGSSAAGMARKLRIPKKLAQKFIDSYYTRYPEVKKWQDDMIVAIYFLRQPSDRRSKTGIPIGYSEWTSCTGRIYTFWEQDNKYSPTGVSFNPREIKNYPVQGLATGDIAPLAFGKLFLEMFKWSPWSDEDRSIQLVNTVHDSILFDCYNEQAARTWSIIAKGVLEKAPQYLKEDLGVDFNLPLRVDAKMGKSWADMKELDLS